MKKLFLTLFAGVSFVLVALGSDSAKVELAPQSVAGKTITISFRDAEYRNNDGDTSRKLELQPWKKQTQSFLLYWNKTTEVFKFDTHNKSVQKMPHKDYNGELHNVIANYVRLSSKTAQIKCMYESRVDPTMINFTLYFVTPSSGMVTWVGYEDDMAEEGRNATFKIE